MPCVGIKKSSFRKGVPYFQYHRDIFKSDVIKVENFVTYAVTWLKFVLSLLSLYSRSLKFKYIIRFNIYFFIGGALPPPQQITVTLPLPPPKKK